MEGNRDDLIVTFMSMIADEVSPEIAADILSSHGWDAEKAFEAICTDAGRMHRSFRMTDLHKPVEVYESSPSDHCMESVSSVSHVERAAYSYMFARSISLGYMQGSSEVKRSLAGEDELHSLYRSG